MKIEKFPTERFKVVNGISISREFLLLKGSTNSLLLTLFMRMTITMRMINKANATMIRMLFGVASELIPVKGFLE